MTFDDIVDLAEKAGCDVSAIDGREYQTMWCDSYQLERFAAALIQAGAASRDAEVAELQKAIDENWVTHQQIVAASKERDQLHDEVAELVAALKPFGAIDLVESRLPAEFAMLILRARAAIAKVRKP